MSEQPLKAARKEGGRGKAICRWSALDDVALDYGGHSLVSQTDRQQLHCMQCELLVREVFNLREVNLMVMKRVQSDEWVRFSSGPWCSKLV